MREPEAAWRADEALWGWFSLWVRVAPNLAQRAFLASFAGLLRL